MASTCTYCGEEISLLHIKQLINDEQNINLIVNINEISQEQQDQMIAQALELCNNDFEQAKLIVQSKNYQEFGAYNQLDHIQKNAVQYVANKAQKLSAQAIPALIERFKLMGYLQQDVDKTLKYLRDDAPIIIHFNLNKLINYLQDTHYRNCFELKGQFRQYHNDARRTWEKQLFNNSYYNCKKEFLLPKYGVLNIVNDMNGVLCCQAYGKSFMVLKEVRLRTTFANQDTSFKNGGSDLATCQHYAHVLLQYSDQELKEVIKCALGKNVIGNSKVIAQYKEAQIHGEINFKKHIQMMFYDMSEWTGHKIDIESVISQFSKKNKIEVIQIERIK